MDQEDHRVVAAFPPPPPYYKAFTEPADDGTHVEMKPPPVPLPGTQYSMFGQTYTHTIERIKEPTLRESGVTELFPENLDATQIPAELKKMHASLNQAFIDVIQRLLKCPSESISKVEGDMRTILLNFHYLTNSFRYTQAQHLLHSELRRQIVNRQKLINRGKEISADVDNLFHSLLSSAPAISQQNTNMDL